MVRQEDLWEGFFADHYGHSRRARLIFMRAGAETRHGVANPLVEDVSGWSTGQRMQRYAAEAPVLGKAAVAASLAEAGVPASDVGMLLVCSCTGYATPGLDVAVARDLGMPADVHRLSVGHMGCYAALPGLAVAVDHVSRHGRAAVLLCVELTSLHVQPSGSPPPTGVLSADEVEQVVSHALFSDAAAAVVVAPDGSPPPAGEFEVLDVVCRTDFAAADHMTWEVTDLGFRMGLSPRVPDVLGSHVAEVIGQLLGRHGLGVRDVAGWAVHPGGPRILRVVERSLGLGRGALDASGAVLRDHGNCSSATVLLVLRELARRGAVPTGGPVVAMAFGPGLTLYAVLLRA
ncbi:MAG: type III polyketide synthase [Micromonosporaceae bacterium]|nr:type III polyketide synthase [Micromonosporaceae bacterium]